MFGGLAFMLHGHMVVGVLGSTLMARVGAERHADALAMTYVRAMDFTGRPMKGYVYVYPPGLAYNGDLQAWVERRAGVAASLPPKPAKR